MYWIIFFDVANSGSPCGGPTADIYVQEACSPADDGHSCFAAVIIGDSFIARPADRKPTGQYFLAVTGFADRWLRAFGDSRPLDAQNDEDSIAFPISGYSIHRRSRNACRASGRSCVRTRNLCYGLAQHPVNGLDLCY